MQEKLSQENRGSPSFPLSLVLICRVPGRGHIYYVDAATSGLPTMSAPMPPRLPRSTLFCHPHLTDKETEARPGVSLVKMPELVSVEAELGHPRPHVGS